MAEQISVFIENTRGRLKDVTALLKDAGIDIRAITIADTPDFGIVRMITGDNATSLDILKRGGFITRTTDVVAVRVPNKPGSLFNVLTVLEKQGINIEYLYSYAASPDKQAILIFRFDNNKAAEKALAESNITILSTQDLLH